MTELSRRTVLAGSTAAAGALSLAPGFIEAFFNSAMAQSASFNKYKVGAIEVAGLADGVNTFPLPDRFVVNQSKEQVQKALAAAKLDTEKLSIPFNPVVFKNGNRIVLIDTGMGPAANAQNPNVGNTVKNLTAEAIADITSTGETLRANHLKILADGLIHQSQATLYAARVADWGDGAKAALDPLLAKLGLAPFAP